MTSSDAPFPPSSASGTFIASSRVKINAPASLVFDILTDPSTWPDWNLFVPRAVSLPSEEPATKMKQGDKIRFLVSLPTTAGPNPKRSDTRTDELVELISVPSDEDTLKIYRANWSMIQTVTLPSFMLRCLRCNEIEVLGEDECEYRSWETFNGLAAWGLRFAAAGTLERGFNEWGEGLKKAVEDRWKAQKG
ncbi:hypothetical protein NA57DRAFT_74154 [Rhizodiscina lignyota]|uniref:Polyketide cyclase/dehydrase n=1 Tax=Rhizodiscina lignyota TaxID=1504668 RepID=A0A9P4IIF1_9PEZI|nr:hypothetical protein NA57DRAFT_74154 [Rhizodiscina lignyota]